MGTDNFIRAKTVASFRDISLTPKSAGHAGQNQMEAEKPVDKPLV
jgi:hypothetical protein